MSNGLAFTETLRANGGGDATKRIAETLRESGLDAPSSLYDEALLNAKSGKFAAATERLRMLLCLDPDDSEASMLLGKVLAARGKWQEALAYVDAASNNGVIPPPRLRESIESSLQKQIKDDENRRMELMNRERSEIQNLRKEAKRLRSDNAVLDAQVEDLQKRVRVWSIATMLVAGSASALLLVTLIFNDTPTQTPDVTVETVATQAIAEPPVDAPAAVVPSEVGLTEAIVPNEQPVEEAPIPNEEVIVAPAVVDEPVLATVDLPAVHTVSSGDTMGGIALRYYGKMSAYPAILEANNLETISLQIGDQLIIPAISE